MSVQKRFLSLIFAAGLLALAGCAYQPPPPPKMAHVRMESVSHAIAFNDGATRLSPSEQDALMSFVSTIPASAVSRTALAADDMSPRAVARAKAVRDFLVARGFDRNTVRLYPTPGIDMRTVVLTVEYAKAVPPQNCPDWSRGASGSYETGDSSDFGCSYYNNLVVQLANPADFDGGHGTPEYNGARDSVSVGHYLTNTPPPMASSSTGSSAGGGGGGSGGGSSGSSGSSGAASGGGATTAASP